MVGYSHEGLINKHLDLVDPIANAELLNSVAKEVDREEINSDSIQFIIDAWQQEQGKMVRIHGKWQALLRHR